MPSWPIVLPAFVMLAGIAQFYEKFFPHGKVDDWIRLGAKGALNWIETKFGRPRLLVALGTLIIALIASSAITFLGFVLYSEFSNLHEFVGNDAAADDYGIMKRLASALWGWGKAAILIEDIFENVVFVVILSPLQFWVI
jgi:hypothetical protein